MPGSDFDRTGGFGNTGYTFPDSSSSGSSTWESLRPYVGSAIGGIAGTIVPAFFGRGRSKAEQKKLEAEAALTMIRTQLAQLNLQRQQSMQPLANALVGPYGVSNLLPQYMQPGLNFATARPMEEQIAEAIRRMQESMGPVPPPQARL